MPLPKSRHAYSDCEEAYNKALDSTEGVRIRMTDFAAANYFRMRMNNCRVINRRDNSAIYEPGHTLYQGSAWDRLMVTIKKVDGEHYVYVESHGIDTALIEEIEASTEETVENIVTEKPAPEHIPVGIVEHITRRF